MKELVYKEKKEEIDKRRKQTWNGFLGSAFFLFLIVFVEVFVLRFRTYTMGALLFTAFMILAALFTLLTISCFIDYRREKRDGQMELDSFREEIELEKVRNENHAVLADKQYRINQSELRRYYDANISQARNMSVLGSALIVFGILAVIICVAIFLFVKDERIILVIGGINGVVSEVAGTIFVTMYNQTVRASIAFHEKLAESNRLLLSNLIANKIENSDLREETLSQVARLIVQAKQTSEDVA